MAAPKFNRPTFAVPRSSASTGVSVSASAPVPSAAGSRSPRRRVLLSGMFHSLCNSYAVSIRNLSCTGAAIECGAPLKKGSEGVLAAEHLDCLCRVIWSRGNLHGLKFDQPLHNAVVLELHRITQDQVQAAEKEAAKEWFHHQAR